MALAKGQVDTLSCAVGSVQLTASSTWAKSGGYFCNLNATSGTADMTVAADTVVSGYVDIGFDPDDSNVSSGVLTVPSTTSDKYRFPFFSAGLPLVVRMPIKSGTTLTKAYSGKLCDLDVTSSKQTIDIDSTSTEVVQILPVTDEDIASSSVRVVINPAKVGR